MEASIPVLDFRRATQPEERSAFVQELGEALEHFGFVALSHHGVDLGLLERAYSSASRCFSLSLAEKRACEDPSGLRERGYTSFGVEHAKYRNAPDLKEFWHIGRELPEEHPERRSGRVPVNRFPGAVPEFRSSMLELFGALESFGLELLDSIGLYLGRPRSWFRGMVEDGNSVLRVIHYPPLVDRPPLGSVRAAAHEDINLLTVLPASTRPGLELLRRDGTWMAIETPEEVMICDTGDIMALLTAGRIPATTHRVVNPDGDDGGRMSMPFFMHPRGDVVLEPIGSGGKDAVLSRDFLLNRLIATGVVGPLPPHAGAPGDSTAGDERAPLEAF